MSHPLILAALMFAAPVQAQSQAQTTGSALTRSLNSAPPAALAPPTPAPTASAPTAAARTVAPPTAAPVTPAPRTAPAPVTAAPSASPRPAAPLPMTSAPTPSTPAPRAVAAPTTTAPTPSPTSTPVAAAPAPRAAPVAPPVEPPTAAPAVLDAAAIAALPFAVELPAGFTITEGRPGPDFDVWTIRRGQQPLVMVYAGPASQFPIYSGEVVQAGGRASVVVTEGNRRVALEHLFTRQTAPQEIHIWITSVDGADRTLAERIGQSIDAR